MYLHVGEIVGDKGEDDVKHLLVVSLGVCAVAIRHCAEELLQQTQCAVDVVLGKAAGYVAGGIVDDEGVRHNV